MPTVRPIQRARLICSPINVTAIGTVHRLDRKVLARRESKAPGQRSQQKECRRGGNKPRGRQPDRGHRTQGDRHDRPVDSEGENHKGQQRVNGMRLEPSRRAVRLRRQPDHRPDPLPQRRGRLLVWVSSRLGGFSRIRVVNLELLAMSGGVGPAKVVDQPKPPSRYCRHVPKAHPRRGQIPSSSLE